jgi:hypothetical protein
METIALNNNIVVIGKKNLKPGRSMTISPGRRNRGNFRIQDQESPSRIRRAPKPISSLFMAPKSTTFPRNGTLPRIRLPAVASRSR